MRSSYVCGRTFAASLLAFGVGLAVVPTASADPTDTDQTEPGAALPATPGASAPSSFTAVTVEESPASAAACKQFSAAMNYAASGYEDFAYNSAGSGNYVNYGDPFVADANAAGRSALKEAAAAAMSASTTPGLQPEISAPMQSWSFNAARLYVIMAVSGGGDALNSAATDLNVDARKVQMACVAAGTRA
jgi:hypothetical protein